MLSFRSSIVAVAMAGLPLTAGATHAQSAMPLGAAIAPPSGFLELCERAPEECLPVESASLEQLSEVRAWAGRTRWNATFSSAGLLPAPAGPIVAPSIAMAPASVDNPAPLDRPDAAPALVRATLTPAERRQDKDAARKASRAKTPLESVSKSRPAKAATDNRHGPGAPSTELVPPSAQSASAPQPVLAEVSSEVLQSVNRRINRSIRRASDVSAFGRDDYWNVPTGPRATGDCEDYVLAKRRVLIELGVAPEALSIAIVRTRQGESHAVLLVATAQGERVLDNLSPWVLPWEEAPYEWLQRQAPGQPLNWVQIAGRGY
jgi:predicted transglutaminase-like cysteine proteinase